MNFLRRLKMGTAFSALLLLVLCYQGCSKDAGFTSVPGADSDGSGDDSSNISSGLEIPKEEAPTPITLEPPIAVEMMQPPSTVLLNLICNPLTGIGINCPVATTINSGLLGKIFYLTAADHADFIPGQNLNNARLNDYFTYGFQVDANIYLTDINVSPRAFDVGFKLPDGSNVKDKGGSDLLEWFAIKLNGYLTLNSGLYDFAILSDDGMAIALNGSEILRDDGAHAPRLKCSTLPVAFQQNVSQALALQYFQGPRNFISMQLLMRPHNPNGTCILADGWQEIPSTAYSK